MQTALANTLFLEQELPINWSHFSLSLYPTLRSLANHQLAQACANRNLVKQLYSNLEADITLTSLRSYLQQLQVH
jgi:hypothetical protein